MFSKPSLIIRIAVSKLVGLVFGLGSFVFLLYFFPQTGRLFRWGFLFWYTTMGAFVGMFGVFIFHPIFKTPFPWWMRGPLLGGWMNFVLTFFAFEEIQPIMWSLFGENGLISSPFWFIADGMFIGLIMDFTATRFGGEGREVVGR